MVSWRRRRLARRWRLAPSRRRHADTADRSALKRPVLLDQRDQRAHPRRSSPATLARDRRRTPRPLRAGLPVIAANAAIILVLALPKVTHRGSSSHPWATWLEDVAVGVPAARHTLARPSSRLSGAVGYLLFDIAGYRRHSPPSARSRPPRHSCSHTSWAISPMRPDPRWHRSPRRRPARRSHALRIPGVSRRGSPARLPHHRVLGAHPRRDARLLTVGCNEAGTIKVSLTVCCAESRRSGRLSARGSYAAGSGSSVSETELMQ